MRIHLAADHGGYALARILEERALTIGYDVVWHGSPEPEPGDDYPIYAVRVGTAVVDDQDAAVDAFGVLVVDDALSGVVAANKVNGARAITASSPNVAAGARRNIDANVLVLEGVAYEPSAWLTLSAFVTTGMLLKVEPARRILQIEEYENAGTIEGWAIQLQPEQESRQHPVEP
jgi:ribose 5-phosphate isomerase B